MQNVMLVGSKVILQKLAGVRRQASQLTKGSEQVKVQDEGTDTPEYTMFFPSVG